MNTPRATHQNPQLAKRWRVVQPLLALLIALVAGCAGTDEPVPGPTDEDPAPDSFSAIYADQLILKVTPELRADTRGLERELDQLGAFLAHVDDSTASLWVRPKADTTAALPELMRQVATLDGVLDVRFDPIMHGTGMPGWLKGWVNACSWHPGDYDGPSMWHLAAMRMGGAWKRQQSAAPIVVALLDTGLALESSGQSPVPGLEATPVAAGYDFVDVDDHPEDANGHGTLLASILASEGDYPGVAPGVTLMPIKVLNEERMGSEAALAAGINHAVAEGADIISMSLAFPPGFVPSGDLATAVADAAEAGVVLVAATGNHGLGEVSYPAAFGQVMAVGGVRLVDEARVISVECAERFNFGWMAGQTGRAEYSAYGAAVDLCAPGGSMEHDLDHDLKPDAVPAVGFDPATPTVYEPFLIAGTSPATVEVAGVAALLMAAGAGPDDVRPVLQQTASTIGEPGFDTACGSGLADAMHSLTKVGWYVDRDLPERFVNPVVTLVEDTAGNRRAVAFVEVVDEQNQPVKGATVLGHFRGPIAHDVSAVTDEHGRVLMASLPASPDATMFEFGVDKILEASCKWCNSKTVIVPQSFSRFELASFRALSGFMAGGAGLDPSPFIIFIDPDALLPLIGDYGEGMVTAPDPSPPIFEPVATIPPDIASWTLVESLITRNFGGDVAPAALVVDRLQVKDDCQISDDILPVYSVGSGLDPSPFRLDESLITPELTFQEVLVQPELLFLDDQPTTETELGLYFGEQGLVVVEIEDSTCEPANVSFSNLSYLSDALVNGQTVVAGGIAWTAVPPVGPPPPPGGPLEFEETALGAALWVSAFATCDQSWFPPQASAAVEGAGCGVQPMP